MKSITRAITALVITKIGANIMRVNRGIFGFQPNDPVIVEWLGQQLTGVVLRTDYLPGSSFNDQMKSRLITVKLDSGDIGYFDATRVTMQELKPGTHLITGIHTNCWLIKVTPKKVVVTYNRAMTESGVKGFIGHLDHIHFKIAPGE
jgi:hypothetical protein